MLSAPSGASTSGLSNVGMAVQHAKPAPPCAPQRPFQHGQQRRGQHPRDSRPWPLAFCACRADGLLQEAERLHLQLEDRQRAAHAAYLRALLADALGAQAQRDAHAAGFVALQQPGD